MKTLHKYIIGVLVVDILLIMYLLSLPRVERATIACKVPYSINYCQIQGGIR